MPLRIGIRFRGKLLVNHRATEFAAARRRAIEAATRSAIADAMPRMARIWAKEMRKIVPVRTGVLRKSLRVTGRAYFRARRFYFLATGIFYGPPVNKLTKFTAIAWKRAEPRMRALVRAMVNERVRSIRP